MNITVTRALRELKLLDDRISKLISANNFVLAAKKIDLNVLNGTKTKVQFGTHVSGVWDSINDLINRKNMIKSEICKSNTRTLVRVGKTEMTVIDAINYRNEILIHKRDLLTQLRNEYKHYQDITTRQNNKVESDSLSLLEQMVGKEQSKGNNEQNKSIIDEYKKTHDWELVDPLKIEDKISEIDSEICAFEAEVDYVLSESNARTEIEISD